MVPKRGTRRVSYLQRLFERLRFNPIAQKRVRSIPLNPGRASRLQAFESLESRLLLANDTFGTAIPIGQVSTTAATVSSAITRDIDVDIIALTVVSGQVVDFNINTPLNGPGGLGSYVRLFSASGQELASNNDGYAPGENNLGFDSYLRYSFQSSGTYYLGVSNYTNIRYNPVTGAGDVSGGMYSTGSYSLIVSALLFDADNRLSTATQVGAVSTTEKSFSSTITPDIDIDMFSVTAGAGQTVDFNIDTATNGPSGLGSYLRLFNSSGQQLAFNNDAAAPGEGFVGFDAYLRYTFTVAGTYFVGVSNFTNNQYSPISGSGTVAGGFYSIGDYTLIVNAPQLTAEDPDDTLAEAVSLGVIATTPVTVNDVIAQDTDVDMYRFSVMAGQVIDFNINTPANGPNGLNSYLRVFSPSGQEIASNNNENAPGENVIAFDSYLRYAFATAGTYFIAVSNFNNTQYNSTSGGGDTSGGLYATGLYKLIVNALPNDPDNTIRNAISLGLVTTTTKTVTTSIAPDIDVDIYSFSVSTGQTVDFNINTPLNGPGGLGSYIRLFNASGQQIAFNNDAAAPGEPTVGFDAYLRYSFSSTGVYYLGVSNFSNTQHNPITGGGTFAGGFNSIGTYSLVVNTPLANVDPDATTGTANALGAITTTEQSIVNNIDPNTDVDMYRFSASAGQTIDFNINTTLNGPGGLGSFLRLFNSLGQQISLNDDANAPGENVVSFDSYLRYTFAISGTYYLGVSNNTNTQYDANTGNGTISGGAHGTGAYTLVVNALVPDFDQTLASATPLGIISTFATTLNSSIVPDVDVDLFSFKADPGQSIDFNINTVQNGPGGLGSYLRLFNAVGQQLAQNNDAAAPGETTVGFDAYLRYTFTAAGDYFVGVSNVTNSQYNPITGGGDVAGGFHSIGTYSLVVNLASVEMADPDDTLVEANAIGSVSTTLISVSASIVPQIDVDMYKFSVTGGQVVDFNINTATNGPGGLGSYLRLFDSTGQTLALNDDANAPGENVIGFDAYLRYSFSFSGTYYLGVSNSGNIQYDPITGSGDVVISANAIGEYTLLVRSLPVDSDGTIFTATALGPISTTIKSVESTIAPDIDVDLYSLSVTAGQVVDFNINTQLNGPGGLQSYLRLFDSSGQVLALNNDAAAPGESNVGFDAYLRYTFPIAGTFYIGVSNSRNSQYNPLTGSNLTSGGFYSIGAYTLIVSTPTVTPFDPDDTLNSATALGAVSTTPIAQSASITPETDVDMFKFIVMANQTVSFNIDTALNGLTGLDSYLRIFNGGGTQLAFNDNAKAPDESGSGFDSFVQFTFASAGTYYVGVSNRFNTFYDPVTGNGDIAGTSNALGAYSLTIQQTTPTEPTTNLGLSVDSVLISEANGVATGTVTRASSNISQAILVSISSSNVQAISVPATVTIPANQQSATFKITGVDNYIVDGVRSSNIVVSAPNATSASVIMQVFDADSYWYNIAMPLDVNANGSITPIDVLLVINYINKGLRQVTSAPPPPYLDVNSDNLVTPADALLIINYLNSHGGGSGEGEATTTRATAVTRQDLALLAMMPAELPTSKPTKRALEDYFGSFSS